MFWFAHDTFGWWAAFGFIWMVLFWVALIALVVWVIRRATQGGGNRQAPTGGPDPLHIAKTRYAKGEISKEEFDQIKRDLDQSG